MTALNDTDRALQDVERQGRIFHIGIGEAARWYADIYRDRVIAERVAMLGEQPRVSVAVAAGALSVPHSPTIAEVRAATLAGSDTGRQVWAQRAALVKRLNAIGRAPR
ncbi:hypothetical protein AB0J28_12415 [Streptosporangium canum]|uniref:hypothetical protein n=1 Tax=Streptosporangium canum TaxID=324952 RepID=UPI0034491D81